MEQPGTLQVHRLAKLAGMDFGIQFMGWMASALLQTEKGYDATGSFTYWTLVFRSYSYASAIAEQKGSKPSLRQTVCSCMVLGWSLRLGLFLGRRGFRYGDSRFKGVTNRPGLLLVYWFMQGLWCLISPLPLLLSLTQDSVDSKPVGVLDCMSWLGWLVGFTIETVADQQKMAWREAGNKGFVEHGLWRYSQHPNYFGEMLLWGSYYLSCANSLSSGWQRAVSFISPSFTYFLLRHLSGVPLLQKANDRRYGSDPRYLEYRKRTSLLLPWFPAA